MPPNPAIKETFQTKLRRTRVSGAVFVPGKISSQLPSILILLFHYAVLKPRREPASGAFHHAEREGLRHEHRGEAFPGLRHCADPDGKELVRWFVLLGRDEHH